MNALPELNLAQLLIYLIFYVLMSAIVLAIAYAAVRILHWVLRRYLGIGASDRAGRTLLDNVVFFLVGGWAICELAELFFKVDLTGVLGALGIVGVAVSLGAQQTISNVFGGVIVSLSKLVTPGDWISIQGGPEVRVIDTDWRCTTLEDETGKRYVVPNSVLVSTTMTKCTPYATFVVPLSLKTNAPDIEHLLQECEQVTLDQIVASGLDWEQRRPKAHVIGTGLGTLEVEVKVFTNRTEDTRSIKRTVLPALITFLQERDVLTEQHPCL